MSEKEKINPLKQFYRAPKLYVKLPSGAKFNEVDDQASTGELPVFPMTTKDELYMRNPDALLNGDAVIKIIQSCVPNVKDTRKLPVCDIDILMIAIRMATYGELMETKIKSPHSKDEDTYEINLNTILENVEIMPPENSITLSNGVVVYVRPLSYDSQTKLNLVAYDQTKVLQNLGQVQGNPDVDQFKNMFVKLAETNMNLLAECVVRVVTPDGEEVENRTHIKEFVDNLDAQNSKKIDKEIDRLNKFSTVTKQTLECKQTGKEFTTDVKLDPADFFVVT